jgi:hypothetical protein
MDKCYFHCRLGVYTQSRKKNFDFFLTSTGGLKHSTFESSTIVDQRGRKSWEKGNAAGKKKKIFFEYSSSALMQAYLSRLEIKLGRKI